MLNLLDVVGKEKKIYAKIKKKHDGIIYNDKIGAVIVLGPLIDLFTIGK